MSQMRKLGIQVITNNLKIDLLYGPAILLQGLYQKIKSEYEKALSTPMFIVIQFMIANIWNQPKCPSNDDWIKKL